ERPVHTEADAKSIGHEQTFETDLPDPQRVREVLCAQVEQVARRLRRHELMASNVTVKIRFGEFQTVTRSGTLEWPTDVTETIRDAACGLFERWAVASFQPVRLIGVSAGGLSRGAG